MLHLARQARGERSSFQRVGFRGQVKQVARIRATIPWVSLAGAGGIAIALAICAAAFVVIGRLLPEDARRQASSHQAGITAMFAAHSLSTGSPRTQVALMLIGPPSTVTGILTLVRTLSH